MFQKAKYRKYRLDWYNAKHKIETQLWMIKRTCVKYASHKLFRFDRQMGGSQWNNQKINLFYT